MEKLKTLKDICIDLPTLDAELSEKDKTRIGCAVVYTHCDVKQLGISWIKELNKGNPDYFLTITKFRGHQLRGSQRLAITEILKDLFNLTEDDLQ